MRSLLGMLLSLALVIAQLVVPEVAGAAPDRGASTEDTSDSESSADVDEPESAAAGSASDEPGDEEGGEDEFLDDEGDDGDEFSDEDEFLDEGDGEDPFADDASTKDVNVDGDAELRSSLYVDNDATLRFMSVDRELSTFVHQLTGAKLTFKTGLLERLDDLPIDVKADVFYFHFSNFVRLPSRLGGIVEAGLRLVF